MPRTTVLQNVWPNLGINYNYNGAGSNATADLTYLKNLGFSRVRILVVDYTLSSTIAQWRAILTICQSLGFSEIIYGLSAYPGGAPLSAANWPTFAAALQTEAAYIAGLNDPRLTFECGNEEELHVDGTTMTVATLQANLITLFATIKAANPNLILSYASEESNHAYWATANITNLDKLGIHIYDTDGTFQFLVQTLYPTQANFSKMYISEWNSNGGYNDFNNEANYSADLRLRLNYIKNSGFKTKTCYLYNFMESTGQWGMRLTNGNFRQAWFDLAENG